MTGPDQSSRPPLAPWWEDDPVTLHVGDAHDILAGLPNASVDCIVTSPPYFGLRDYGTGTWQGGRLHCAHSRAPAIPANGRICPACGATWVDRQYGLEATLGEYIDHLVAVFRQARRVLHPDGTCWLNLDDSYVTGQSGRRDAPTRYPSLANTQRDASRVRRDAFLPAKNLLGVPWRIAFALQADSWILRNGIVWAKTNPMPESVRDRFSTGYRRLPPRRHRARPVQRGGHHRPRRPPTRPPVHRDRPQPGIRGHRPPPPQPPHRPVPNRTDRP